MHADHGVQFTSWAFGDKIRAAGLMPSFGSVGDGLDNAMMESFWSSMQIELLNRKMWKTRLELANAIFDYIEIFCGRQRRHSSLDYRTAIEHELLSEKNLIPPETHHRGGNQAVGQVKMSPAPTSVPDPNADRGQIIAHTPRNAQSDVRIVSACDKAYWYDNL